MDLSDFNNFKSDLKSRLDNNKIREIEKPDFTPAAVFILFMHKDNQPHILFTKRSQHVKEHKGQISLPGGAYDVDDNGMIETAYRETYEEVGIPEKEIEYLGRYDDYISITEYRVETYIGSINFPFPYKMSIDEIDDYIEAPFSMFINRDYEKVEYFQYHGIKRKVYFYNYRGYEIWGLTARIITDLGKFINIDND